MTHPLVHSSIPGIRFPALPGPECAVALALQFQLSESQWLKSDALRATQQAQLQPLLVHANLTSPYYRTLFAKHQLTPTAEADEEFFKKIPISTRADLQAAGTSLHSTVTPPSHGQVTVSCTSGSSGQPLTFQKTQARSLIWSALTLREYLWHKRDFSRRIGAIRLLENNSGAWPEGVKAETWSKPINAIYPTGPLFALNVVATLEQQLEWLERTKLDYLTSYPSNLIALTHYAKSIKRALPKVLELRTSGETLTADDAKFLSEAWGTKVVDMYSCEEVGYLALQCPDQPCYHIQSEHVILEVVDEHGRACGPGEIGRVVITDLHNFATPFIRYDIGDHAEVGEPCACGRGLPTLKRILGRTRNRLTLPDGRKVFPRLGERSLSSIPDVNVFRFRVIQRSLTTIELQLVCSRSLSEQEKSEVAAKLQKSLGHPFEIIFSFPENLTSGPNGKFEVFVSEVA